jgi:glycosyl transferase family 9 (putative heptosyltransferase)
VIPTLHPLADLARRYRQTPDGLEAEMTHDEALACADQPGVEWWEVKNHSSALYLTGQTQEALTVAYRALGMRRTVSTLVNVSVILETLGKFDEALPYAEEAYYLDLVDNRARALYGEALLRMGRFADGWPLYVAERASHAWLRPYVREWEGPRQSLDGKRLLVLEGGGFGDNVYFLRWLDVLRRWGAQIDYVCQPTFAPLVRTLGYVALENWQGNVDLQFRDYDYFTGLLSLGHKLGVTLQSYRWSGPYVKGKRPWGNRSTWLRRRRIGVCWRAGEGKSPRKQRSLSVNQVESILGCLPACTLVNLTLGHDLPNPIGGMKVDNWQQTADLLATLDLVISVDTGVAHLSGAMGLPTWVLLPGAAAWHYPLGHDYHPLYPSMRLFRNYGEGIDNAVLKVNRALEAL